MSADYRNPPKGSRFKRGRSGNPKGRPKQKKRQVSAGSLFRKVAREYVPVDVGGSRIKLSRWDTYVRQIYTLALSKNHSASRLLDQLRRQFPGKLLPGDPCIFIITEADTGL